MVTVAPPRVLPSVLTPPLLTSIPAASEMDTTVPASSSGSGLALGKLTSFAIAMNAPTASN